MTEHVGLTIAVGITVKNDRAGMVALLDALLRQTRPPDEVIIVDAASTDGTFAVCEEFRQRAPFPVRALVEACTRGAGRARILALATSDLVAFTDSDCVPPPAWLENYAAAWTGGRMGALGGPSVPPPSSNRLQRVTADVMGHTEKASFGGVNTCNALYSRAAAVEAGGFDASMQTAEDPDLNARIHRAGYELRRIDNPVEQARRSSWRALVRQHFEYGKGAAALLDRYPEWFSPIERWMGYALALAAVCALLGAFVTAWALVLALPLLVLPWVVHRRILFGRHMWVRLGVLWAIYIPYHAGIVAGRGPMRGRDLGQA